MRSRAVPERPSVTSSRRADWPGGIRGEGQGNGALRGAALDRHDGRAQVRQQQGDGLMIPGGRHGESRHPRQTG